MKYIVLLSAFAAGLVAGASEVEYVLGDARHYSQGAPSVEGGQQGESRPAPAGWSCTVARGDLPTRAELRISTSRSEIRLFPTSSSEVFVGDRNTALLGGEMVDFGPQVKIQYFRSSDSGSDQLLVYDDAGRLVWVLNLRKVK